jgi:hypothetical protein
MSLGFSRVAKIAEISLIGLLAGCGNSGPSKSEAEKALDNLVAQFTGAFGNNNANAAHVKLTDLKCSETGDDTYSCQVLVNIGGTDVQDKYTFTKLGGTWRATH